MEKKKRRRVEWSFWSREITRRKSRFIDICCNSAYVGISNFYCFFIISTDVTVYCRWLFHGLTRTWIFSHPSRISCDEFDWAFLRLRKPAPLFHIDVFFVFNIFIKNVPEEPVAARWTLLRISSRPLAFDVIKLTARTYGVTCARRTKREPNRGSLCRDHVHRTVK